MTPERREVNTWQVKSLVVVVAKRRRIDG